MSAVVGGSLIPSWVSETALGEESEDETHSLYNLLLPLLVLL